MYPQSGSWGQCIPSLCFLLSIQSKTLAHGMAPPTFKVDFSPQFVSVVVWNPIKLILKIDHHKVHHVVKLLKYMRNLFFSVLFSYWLTCLPYYTLFDMFWGTWFYELSLCKNLSQDFPQSQHWMFIGYVSGLIHQVLSITPYLGSEARYIMTLPAFRPLQASSVCFVFGPCCLITTEYLTNIIWHLIACDLKCPLQVPPLFLISNNLCPWWNSIYTSGSTSLKF